jgi:hypothetical protein
MKNVFCLLAVALFLSTAFPQTAAAPPSTPKTIAFTNGLWFDGHSFRRRIDYSVQGVITFRKPGSIDAVVDFGGGYVVPPFGEAHNHNVEPLNKVDLLIQRYLAHGIFYVKNPDNLPAGRDQVLSKINRPEKHRCDVFQWWIYGPGRSSLGDRKTKH